MRRSWLYYLPRPEPHRDTPSLPPRAGSQYRSWPVASHSRYGPALSPSPHKTKPQLCLRNPALGPDPGGGLGPQPPPSWAGAWFLILVALHCGHRHFPSSAWPLASRHKVLLLPSREQWCSFSPCPKARKNLSWAPGAPGPTPAIYKVLEGESLTRRAWLSPQSDFLVGRSHLKWWQVKCVNLRGMCG